MGRPFQKVFALFLLASLMMQAFYSPFIIIDYYLNTAAYKKYCINKQRPVLHCDGKCQLMKKIKQEESKNNQNPERRNTNEYQLYLAAIPYEPDVYEYPLTRIYPPLQVSASRDLSFDFFQPPRL